MAMSAAVDLALKMDDNRRQDLANKLGRAMSGD
jgi:hypothetical protein